MQFQNPLAGGDTLVRSALHSVNYNGNVGWSINRDGSAFFGGNVTIVGGQVADNTSLYYNGTPALGNLIASISSTAGTDTYGNSYLAGVVVYGVTGNTEFFCEMNKGSISMGRMNDQANSGGIGFGFFDVVNVQHPAVTMVAPNGTDPTVFSIVDFGRAYLVDTTGTNKADLAISGTVIKTDLVGNLETWHTPTFGTGWVSGPSGGSYRGLQYRLDAEDNLILSGTVHCNTTTPSSTVFTLPAGYIPKSSERPGIVSNQAGTYAARSLEINSSTGVCTVDPVPTAASTDLYIYATIPMGNEA